MESKALALGKQLKAEALNSNVHQTVGWIKQAYPPYFFVPQKGVHDEGFKTIFCLVNNNGFIGRVGSRR